MKSFNFFFKGEGEQNSLDSRLGPLGGNLLVLEDRKIDHTELDGRKLNIKTTELLDKAPQASQNPQGNRNQKQEQVMWQPGKSHEPEHVHVLGGNIAGNIYEKFPVFSGADGVNGRKQRVQNIYNWDFWRVKKRKISNWNCRG